MSNNLISIIIPTYNREKKLKKAILSVINQTYVNWELIVVDNNSKDNSEILVNKFKNKKIHFFKINNNGIIARSRNFGISKSKGDYICFLDSDDWWHKKKLYYLNKYIEKDFNLIYHDMFLSNKKYLFKKTGYCRNLSKPIYDDLLNNGPAFPTSSVCVNKKIMQYSKGFNENKNFLAWEDFDSWINFSKINEKFVKIPKTLGFIRIDDDNFLNDEISIKNIFSFKEKYFINQKLPNWALLSLVRSYYKMNEISKSIFYLNQIIIKKSSFRIILRLIFYKIILKLKI